MAFGWDDAIGLGLSAASSIPQWLTGNDQERQANRLSAGLQRPTMGIPDSQTRALTSAENQAQLSQLPGYNAISGQLDQTTAGQIAMIERMGIGGPTSINAASRAYGMQQQRENELGVAGAQMRLNNQQILRDELHNQAQWEQQAWNWNERMPYEAKVKAIEALKEGSIRNKNAAWQNLFGVGANIFSGGIGGDGMGDWWKGVSSEGGSSVSVPPLSDLQPKAYESEITRGPEQKRVMELMWGGAF